MSPSLADLAATFRTTPAQLEAIVAELARRAPANVYYVFRVARRERGSATTVRKPRTVVAFPTADDAMAWAQRSGQSANARLRAITPMTLLTYMLADPTIIAVRFLHHGAEARPNGPAVAIQRDDLVRAIDQARSAPPESLPLAVADGHESPAAADEALASAAESPALTAERYDALQFGVDFVARARFRVALAEAIEQVVAAYEPPPGSVDAGPRSIFATTAVEEWLRAHGFPRARQRRWIDITDDERWTHGVELCEIDAGTQNHLLIQLIISVDETGRQYIREVRVTA